MCAEDMGTACAACWPWCDWVANGEERCACAWDEGTRGVEDCVPMCSDTAQLVAGLAKKVPAPPLPPTGLMLRPDAPGKRGPEKVAELSAKKDA
jgi:hypothetical protein